MLWFNIGFFLIMTLGAISKISSTYGKEQGEYFWFGLICASLLIMNVVLVFHS